MTAELDIHDCVYCSQPLDSMPLVNRQKVEDPLAATYYCGNCESNFTLYFDEDASGNFIKV